MRLTIAGNPFLLRFQKAIGGALVVLGSLLLLATIAYVGLGIYGEAQLNELVVPETETPLTLEDLRRDLFVPGIESLTSSESVLVNLPSASGNRTTGLTEVIDSTVGAPGGSSVRQLQPLSTGIRGASDLGNALDPTYGDGPSESPVTGLTLSQPGSNFEFAPLRSEATGSSTGSTIGAQFEPVDWAELPLSIGGRPRGERILIPAIGLDSLMVELGTRWDGPNLQWETADSAVGHHLGTPNPGELGNSVLSGHINSPFRGEGSIFRRLPEVAALLTEGRTVDIILESSGGRYLYRATSSDVLLPEQVNVFRLERTPSLTLITCVPATHYTHRFLVNAVLVGYIPA